MKTTFLAAVAVPAVAMAFCFSTACTNDPTALLPAGTGSVVGGGSYGGGSGSAANGGSGSSSGGNESSPPEDAGSTSTTPPPGNGGDDANAPRPDPEGGTGTGSGGHQDAGSGSGGFGVDGQVPVIDSGTTTTSGPLGSCTNPACGTQGNQCGCQATDSNGNTVQLGCQAGGQCACFVNGNQSTNAFDENGACNLQQGPVQDFLQYCTAVCN